MIKVLIYGELKSLKEWGNDPRCPVTPDAVRRRYANGVRGEDLLAPRAGRGGPAAGRARVQKPIVPQIDTPYRHKPWVRWHPPNKKI